MPTLTGTGLHHQQFRLLDFLAEEGNPIDIARSRRKAFRKNPSATTNTTASTNNTTSSTFINAQTKADNDYKSTTSKVVTPSSQCQPRRHNSNKHNNNDFNPIATFPPPAFVDETQIDEIEVALTAPSPPPVRVIRPTLSSGPSITSTLSVDTVLDDDGDPLLYNAVSFSPAHGNNCSNATVGGVLLIEAKDRYASSSNFLSRHNMRLSISIPHEEDDDITTVVKVSSGIPKVATCHHRDDGEDIDSCITASTEGGAVVGQCGIASSSSCYSNSAHGDRDDPESGPHMLSFLHEQDSCSDYDTTTQYWNQDQRTTQTHSPPTSNLDLVFRDKKHEYSSRKKGIGHFMSKLMSKIK
jgi:hypothetical protein